MIRLGVLLTYDLSNARRLESIRPSMDRLKLKQLTWLAAPLGIVMMIISLNTNIPRYFIVHYIGEEQLGYFSAITYLKIAGDMIIRALGQSASPRLAKYYAAGNCHAFKNLLLKLLVIGGALGIAGIIIATLVGQQILVLLYRPDYAKYANMLVWIMIAAGVSYIASFLGYGMTAARAFKVQPVIFSIVTGATTLCCWLWVPTYGLLGAARAIIVSAAIQVTASAVVNVHAIYKLKLNS